MGSMNKKQYYMNHCFIYPPLVLLFSPGVSVKSVPHSEPLGFLQTIVLRCNFVLFNYALYMFYLHLSVGHMLSDDPMIEETCY